MMNETEKLMKGSIQEDEFFIVHDAFVLMAVKEKKTRRDRTITYIDGFFPSMDCSMGLLKPTVRLIIAPISCL